VVDRDVVTAKLSAIDRCLARIAEVQGPRRGELEPLDVEDITALNLQRAVQAAIDLGAHVLASEGHGVPAETAEVFTLLEVQGIVEPELAERLRRMVGFRNIAIHEYQKLNPAIVQAIVERHLGDLRALGSLVVQRFGLGETAS
jgi:uncharacterized protein YutE (UPF0331/DUF86 family)